MSAVSALQRPGSHGNLLLCSDLQHYITPAYLMVCSVTSLIRLADASSCAYADCELSRMAWRSGPQMHSTRPHTETQPLLS